MALMILIFFLLLIMAHFLSTDMSIRESVVRAYLLVFGITAILTEILSLKNQVTYQGVLSAWLILTGITTLWIFRKLTGHKQEIKTGKLGEHFIRIRQLPWIDNLIILCIGLILIATLFIAVIAPSNNFDSMTYHMARVSHWIQQKNVYFYSTSIPRQNFSLPLAEYMILHLQLLSRSDIYANLVQWSGFFIAIVVSSLIAKLFRVTKSGQVLAAFFTATLPMAILQSTSTQNDLITGVFCLIFAYYLIRLIRSQSWSDTFYAGLALGLALLAKGTAYIYCAAIGLIIGGVGLFNQNRAIRLKLTKYLGLIILCAILLNVGMYYRNMDLYSHPLSTATGRITNDKFSVEVLYTNLVRNGSMHLAVPIPAVNDIMTNKIIAHLGDSALDPNSTFPGSTFRIRYLINEDEAGNLLHFLLLSVIILVVPWIRDTKNILIYAYTGAIAISIFIFSLLLKWQPWGSRLQIPIFLLGAPLIGFVKDRIKGSRYLLLLGVISFSLYSVPYIMLNSTRPLVPIFRKDSPLRSNQVKRFFSNRPNLYDEYADIIAPFYKDSSVLWTDREILYFSSNMSIYQDYRLVMNAVNDLDEEEIGLHLGSNDWEYPIWVLAGRNASAGSPRFMHIAVDDISQNLTQDMNSLPRYIISTRMSNSGLIAGKEYEILIDTPSISLLKR